MTRPPSDWRGRPVLTAPIHLQLRSSIYPQRIACHPARRHSVAKEDDSAGNVVWLCQSLESLHWTMCSRVPSVVLVKFRHVGFNYAWRPPR